MSAAGWLGMLIAVCVVVPCASCGGDDAGNGGDDAPADSGSADVRGDGARRLDIEAAGSLQNPAFSPDGETILLTRFRDGYNIGAADIFAWSRDGGAPTPVVSDGSVNVNLPCAAWNALAESIVFSSSRRSSMDLR